MGVSSRVRRFLFSNFVRNNNFMTLWFILVYYINKFLLLQLVVVRDKEKKKLFKNSHIVLVDQKLFNPL